MPLTDSVVLAVESAAPASAASARDTTMESPATCFFISRLIFERPPPSRALRAATSSAPLTSTPPSRRTSRAPDPISPYSPPSEEVDRVDREQRRQQHDQGSDPQHDLPDAAGPRHLAGLAGGAVGLALARPVCQVETPDQKPVGQDQQVGPERLETLREGRARDSQERQHQRTQAARRSEDPAHDRSRERGALSPHTLPTESKLRPGPRSTVKQKIVNAPAPS